MTSTPVLELVSDLTGDDPVRVKAAQRKLHSLPEEDHEVVEAFLRTTYNNLVRTFLVLHDYPRDYPYCSVEVFFYKKGMSFRVAVLIAVLQEHTRHSSTFDQELIAYLDKHSKLRRLSRLVSDIVVNDVAP